VQLVLGNCTNLQLHATVAKPKNFSSASFLLLLFKGVNLDHFGVFFFGHNFSNLNLGKLVPTTFLLKRRMINLSKWWKEGE
jgi:hypothetical protein